MPNSLANGLATRFRFNSTLLGMVAKDFAPADWNHQAGGAFANTPHWILGHLVMSRRYVLRSLGVIVENEPWEELFAPGSKSSDSASFPSVEELQSAYPSLGDEIARHLRGMTPEDLAKPVKRPFPDGGADRLGAASFMQFHESYHLGQLGMFRRLVGKPGFA